MEEQLESTAQVGKIFGQISVAFHQSGLYGVWQEGSHRIGRNHHRPIISARLLVTCSFSASNLSSCQLLTPCPPMF